MTKRRIAIGFGITCVVAVAGLYLLGWTLSRAVPADIGPAPTPLDAETVTFPSESGSVIHGWLSRASPGRGSVLLLPGIRANRLSMVKRAEFLRRGGYSTLLVDFQATGESAGDAITFGWRERLDVLASVQYLKERLRGEPVGVIGVSLGGAATLLATPPLRVQAVVVEAVYPSIDRALVNRLNMRIGPLGHIVAPLLMIQLRARLDLRASDLRPVDHIARLECPVLVVAGALDRHTTDSDTQLLFAAAREPKELWVIRDAAHVDYLEFAGEAYRRRILAFLQSAFDRNHD